MTMPAARMTDLHLCPLFSGLLPHIGGPILPPCWPTVLIGDLPAARANDMLTCILGPPDMILCGISDGLYRQPDGGTAAGSYGSRRRDSHGLADSLDWPLKDKMEILL